MGKLGPRVASRLSRNACLSPSAVVTSMIYLKRLKMNNPEYLQRVPSSELFIVSMMVASKYLFDDGTGDFIFDLRVLFLNEMCKIIFLIFRYTGSQRSPGPDIGLKNQSEALFSCC